MQGQFCLLSTRMKIVLRTASSYVATPPDCPSIRGACIASRLTSNYPLLFILLCIVLPLQVGKKIMVVTMVGYAQAPILVPPCSLLLIINYRVQVMNTV
jgi:hypothetical protein